MSFLFLSLGKKIDIYEVYIVVRGIKKGRTKILTQLIRLGDFPIDTDFFKVTDDIYKKLSKMMKKVEKVYLSASYGTIESALDVVIRNFEYDDPRSRKFNIGSRK